MRILEINVSDLFYSDVDSMSRVHSNYSDMDSMSWVHIKYSDMDSYVSSTQWLQWHGLYASRRLVSEQNFIKEVFRSEQQSLVIGDLVFKHLATIYELSGQEILHSWLDNIACFAPLISTRYIV